MGRRALELGAAGGHHLFLVGPPGVGKTMLAQRLPTILPPLSDTEALEVTAVHSVAGTLVPATGMLRRPPFQAPHHSASVAALVGGGAGQACRGGLLQRPRAGHGRAGGEHRVLGGGALSQAEDPVTGLDALPGTTGVELQGARVTLRTTDLDATVAALYRKTTLDIRDLQLHEADLEDAFLALTKEA